MSVKEEYERLLFIRKNMVIRNLDTRVIDNRLSQLKKKLG